MSSVIQVENLSKAYQIGEFSTGTLSQDVERWWLRMRGKEDKFGKIVEINDRSTKGESNLVWSLKDINFEIKQGDAVGIIGRNGAGKSTLLKILSRVTTPSTGSVKVKGRIASLLEVGTGFHPELTGRENIFLNGAILGMRKHEIKRKFNEIVEFSGVERYIDTPVKRYSSGMYVRLAFAVAAHLESEILIVDEVLAVGDAEFQKKCLGKMGDVSKGEGRTILFVSHNLTAIENLCTKGIFLSNGQIEAKGDIYDCMNSYIKSYNNKSNVNVGARKDRTGNGKMKITGFHVEDQFGTILNTVKSGGSFQFAIQFESNNYPEVLRSVVASLALVDNKNQIVFLVRTNFDDQDLNISVKSGVILCKVEDFALTNGEYSVSGFLGFKDVEVYDYVENITELSVEGGDFFGTGSFGYPTLCKVLTRANWKVSENEALLVK